MPANLPPQYFEAEKRYRLAREIPERIEALEEMLAIMPKHKGTDKLRAELRRRIAKLSEEAERRPALGRRGSLYYIRKEGAGQVVLIGLPNVGKSRLVSAVTNAAPEVADYPFTTKTFIPGMMPYENVQIQLVDLPPITDPEARSWLSGVLRNADVLLLVVDLSADPMRQMNALIEELEKRRIAPVGREGEKVSDEVLRPKKAVIIGTKSDLDNLKGHYKTLESSYGERFPLVSISAERGAGLEQMKEAIYKALHVIRVYTKAPGEKADFSEPVTMKKGSTVDDAAESVHKDFRNKLKYALIWGSGKFGGQRVKRNHTLQDGDVIELHI